MIPCEEYTHRMSKWLVDIDGMREMSTNPDKWRAFEREVMGAIAREDDGRKEKIERDRVARERKAKRKRQRQAASMA
jgi:hypothetical protein